MTTRNAAKHMLNNFAIYCETNEDYYLQTAKDWANLLLRKVDDGECHNRHDADEARHIVTL